MAITAKIDYKELTAVARMSRGLDRRMVQGAASVLRKISLAGERDIKGKMPVKTGRARASWGHGSRESVWATSDRGLTITQGSNVPYIDALNNGHSRQAPAGFIDTAELKMKITLDGALGKLDPIDPQVRMLMMGLE